MIINEILVKENLNKKFKDNNGDVWQVVQMESNGKLTLEIENGSRNRITNITPLEDILNLNFEFLGKEKIDGMNRKLFLELAFCRAFEIEFNQDEYHLMDNLEYDDDNYCCLQDVVKDEKLNENIDKYADKIRNFINNLD